MLPRASISNKLTEIQERGGCVVYYFSTMRRDYKLTFFHLEQRFHHTERSFVREHVLVNWRRDSRT